MNKLLKILKALAEPSRLRLFNLCFTGEFTVSELVQILGQSQPRVSRHLRILCEAGLLQKIREGNWMLYRIAVETDGAMIGKKILDSLPKSDPAIDRDQERLSSVMMDRSKSATDYFRFRAEQWDQLRKQHVDESQIEDIEGIFGQEKINNFLDVGTGTGRMLELAGPYAEKMEGIDQSREMLAVARRNLEQTRFNNYSIRQDDMYQLSAADENYDIVCIHQVLHFAQEPGKVIAEASRVLQQGGRLVIVDFVTHKIVELREIHHHYRLGFSDGEFVHWFQRSGLHFRSPTHIAGRQLTVGIWIGTKMSKK